MELVSQNGLIIGVFCLMIWGAILYMIIRLANDTTKRDVIQMQNQKLLALIAKQLGVEGTEIEKILNFGNT